MGNWQYLIERFDVALWRFGLAKAAVAAPENDCTVPYRPEGHFQVLIRICYLTPLLEKMLPLSLAAYNLWGRFGLAWMCRQIQNIDYLYFVIFILNFSSYFQLKMQSH